MKNKNLKKRIISKLEVKGSNLIKGCQFDGLRSLGLASNFAKKYFQDGIDEIIYQDIVASLYDTEPKYDEIKKISENTFVPITVAGGIKRLDQIKKIFDAGADKIAINTSAILNPKLLEESSKEFGSQSVVSSIEIYSESDFENNLKSRKIWIKNGKEETKINLIDWINQVQDYGVGEILITSIEKDGMGKGLDVHLANEIGEITKVPVIISGGAGSVKDVINFFKKTNINAVCISSLFHYHYYKFFDTSPFKNYKKLRAGENIDIGNYDFINHGYGQQKYNFVKPISIFDLKKIIK